MRPGPCASKPPNCRALSRSCTRGGPVHAHHQSKKRTVGTFTGRPPFGHYQTSKANGLAVQHSRGFARSAAHLWRAPSGAVPACFAMGSSALSCALLSLFGRGRDRGPYRLHVHARPTRACPAMPPALGVPARKQSRWSGGSVGTCPCGAVESQTGVLVSTLASASVDNNPQRHGGGRAVEPPESRASSGGRGGRGSPRLSSVGCPATLPKPGRKPFGGRAPTASATRAAARAVTSRRQRPVRADAVHVFGAPVFLGSGGGDHDRGFGRHTTRRQRRATSTDADHGGACSSTAMTATPRRRAVCVAIRPWQKLAKDKLLDSLSLQRAQVRCSWVLFVLGQGLRTLA